MATAVTPHDLWVWFDRNHWKHWHGVTTRWWPFESLEAVKSYRSIRSFVAQNAERSSVCHCNQWYDSRGPGEESNFKYGPWILEEQRHALADGIVHPFTDSMRFYQFPNGDLGWLRTKVDPSSPFVASGEIQFMHPEKNGRVAVSLTQHGDGRFSVSQIMEEVRDTDSRPDPSWWGTLWKLEPLLALDESRQEPTGKFVGDEMTMTPSLELTKVHSVEWGGFYSDLSEAAKPEYALVHLPNSFTACVPKQPAFGKAFMVHWLVNEHQVRMLAWCYQQDGKLKEIKTGTYSLV